MKTTIAIAVVVLLAAQFAAMARSHYLDHVYVRAMHEWTRSDGATVMVAKHDRAGAQRVALWGTGFGITAFVAAYMLYKRFTAWWIHVPITAAMTFSFFATMFMALRGCLTSD